MLNFLFGIPNLSSKTFLFSHAYDGLNTILNCSMKHGLNDYYLRV